MVLYIKIKKNIHQRMTSDLEKNNSILELEFLFVVRIE
jgi:hypothetical protein